MFCSYPTSPHPIHTILAQPGQITIPISPTGVDDIDVGKETEMGYPIRWLTPPEVPTGREDTPMAEQPQLLDQILAQAEVCVKELHPRLGTVMSAGDKNLVELEEMIFAAG